MLVSSLQLFQSPGTRAAALSLNGTPCDELLPVRWWAQTCAGGTYLAAQDLTRIDNINIEQLLRTKQKMFSFITALEIFSLLLRMTIVRLFGYTSVPQPVIR
jgi:hypothetical protein